jgi:pyruvate dehydrogenase E1 component
MTDQSDLDPVETREWLDAIDDVIDRDGTERAHYLLDRAVKSARARGAVLPFSARRRPTEHDSGRPAARLPGDAEMEWRIRTINRWNAMATVVRRNKESGIRRAHRQLRLLGGAL